MTLPALPVFMKLAGRAVILLGEGPAAEAKRRLIERSGATAVGEEDPDARIAIVAIEDEVEAHAAVARLKARGILVNATDRPSLCDFTLPAIVDRSPLMLAIGTGGASAGLAKALRERLEALLPATLGTLADALKARRAAIVARWPDPTDRRRTIDAALGPGGMLDCLVDADMPDQVDRWLAEGDAGYSGGVAEIILTSADADDLTLRQARLLSRADVLVHDADVPSAILDRARADACRLPADAPTAGDQDGLVVRLRMAPAP